MTGRGRARGGRGGFSRRVRVCLAIFGALFAVVLYRAFDLQFLNTGKAKRWARIQQFDYHTPRSKRGAIYDRHGNLVASSRFADSFALNPQKIEDPEQFARAVSGASGVSYETVLRRASKKKQSFVWLTRTPPEDVADRLRALKLAGLEVRTEQKRIYPQGRLMGPVVGFTNIDSRGIEGLEYSLNKRLSGRVVKTMVSRDGRGNPMLFDAPAAPRSNGADVFLTVDSNIQYAVEDELRNAVEKFGADSASAVMIEPSTGRIIAMASHDTVSGGGGGADALESESDGKRRRAGMRNLAVLHAFEPGSIMKPFLVAAALEEGAVEKDTVFDCEGGSRTIGNTTIRDSSPHDRLTVTDTLVYSSNICSSKIAEILGANTYHRYLRDFGFGLRSGTLLPGEHRGIIAPPRNWGRVGLATIAFGQGVSVNALQMAVAVSAIANGGYMMIPRIVDKIVDAAGNVVFSKKPEARGRVISYDVSRKVADMMRETVERRRGPGRAAGTGWRAAVSGYTVAGKTGTAQIAAPGGGYLEDIYTTSFVGFAPARNPLMALVVVVNRPRTKKYGSQVAAPVFSAIAGRTLGMLELSAPASAPEDKPFPAPDLRGKSVRDVARWAFKAGVELRVSGRGFAAAQSPPPGALIKRGEVCEVSFSGGSI